MAAVNQLLAARDRGDMGPVGFDLDMTLIDSRSAILASFAGLAEDTGTAIDLAAVDSRLGIKLEDELVVLVPAGSARRRGRRSTGGTTYGWPSSMTTVAAGRARGAGGGPGRGPARGHHHGQAPGIGAAEPEGDRDHSRRGVHLRPRAGEGRRAAPGGRGRLRRRQPAGHGRRRGRRRPGGRRRHRLVLPRRPGRARAPTWCSTRWRPSPPGTGPSTAAVLPRQPRPARPAAAPGIQLSPPPPDTAGAAGRPAGPGPPA